MKIYMIKAKHNTNIFYKKLVQTINGRTQNIEFIDLENAKLFVELQKQNHQNYDFKIVRGFSNCIA